LGALFFWSEEDAVALLLLVFSFTHPLFGGMREGGIVPEDTTKAARDAVVFQAEASVAIDIKMRTREAHGEAGGAIQLSGAGVGLQSLVDQLSPL
jgi:hypothetical protein